MSLKGDIRANFEQLQSELRYIKYIVPIEQGQIFDGIPLAFLPIIHHALLLYSPLVSRFISENGFELQAKNDYRFIENFYKLMLNHFGGYKPQITIQQFFTNGFAECKIIMCIEVIQKVKDKHKQILQFEQNTAKKPLKPSSAQNRNKKYVQNNSNQVNADIQSVRQNNSITRNLDNQREMNFQQSFQNENEILGVQKVKVIKHNHNNQPSNIPIRFEQQQILEKEDDYQISSLNYNASFSVQGFPQQTGSIQYHNQNKNDLSNSSHKSDQNASGLNEILKLVSSLNESVRGLSGRFDRFQEQVDSKIYKLQGEMVILKNQVNIIESTMKKTAFAPENNRIKELKKDNEQLFERDTKKYDFQNSFYEQKKESEEYINSNQFGQQTHNNPFKTAFQDQLQEIKYDNERQIPNSNESIQPNDPTEDLIARVQNRLQQSKQMLEQKY